MYVVKVVESETGKVFYQSVNHSSRTAEKLERALDAKIDHKKFEVIVEESDAKIA